MTRSSAASRLAAGLRRAGVTTMFGVPGGGPNLEVIGAAEQCDIRFVLAHGETAAAIMASTHGLLSGSPTAVIATRGPGAASLVNGVAQATLDRFPLTVITDTVGASTRHRIAHQRIDQRSLFAPITVGSVTMTSDITEQELDAALSTATRWPRGAVHVDYDPSAATGDVVSRRSADTDGEADLQAANIAMATQLMGAATRPVVIAGAEAAANHEVVERLTGLSVPILTTYQAIGTVPTTAATSAGLFTNGALEAPVLEAADLIITVGLDPVEPIPAPWDRGCQTLTLASISNAEGYFGGSTNLVGPLPGLVDLVGEQLGDATWSQEAGQVFTGDARAAIMACEPDSMDSGAGLGPVSVTLAINRHRPQGSRITVDAGAHFLAVMPLIDVSMPHELLISNGLATMGFAVPAAIGAAVAEPDVPIWAVVGDGGLSMTMAELETIVRHDLDITVLVYNDAALSLIEIKQGKNSGGAGAVRYNCTDFAAVARASGMAASVVESKNELTAALSPAERGPRLLDIRLDPSSYPALLKATRG